MIFTWPELINFHQKKKTKTQYKLHKRMKIMLNNKMKISIIKWTMEISIKIMINLKIIQININKIKKLLRIKYRFITNKNKLI